MGDGWGGEEQEAARIAEEDMDGEPPESGKQSLTLMLCCTVYTFPRAFVSDGIRNSHGKIPLTEIYATGEIQSIIAVVWNHADRRF